MDGVTCIGRLDFLPELAGLRDPDIDNLSAVQVG